VKVSIHLTDPFVASWHLTAEQHRHLEQLLPNAEIRRFDTEEAFLASLVDADIAVVWKFEEAWLARAPRLQWLVTPAAGAEGLQLSGRPGLDIGHGSFHGPLIGETVMGLLLGHCRALFLADQLTRTNAWPRAELAASMRTLRGARLTVLGFGAIGRWIGRLAKPFGAQITGISRRPGEPPEYFANGDRWLGVAALDECLSRTEFLVIVLPATRETDRIIDARRIALLPHGAVIVNVGRGNAIDESALAAALSRRALAGAYLDVFAKEPLPASSPLRETPNTLLLPHVSAIAPQHLDLFIAEFAERYVARYGVD
jgi:D-2-hydroxyacid dehydrogenase (NADP+)